MSVPVLPPVAAIIKKYKDYCQSSPDKHLLPVPSNQKIKVYLKELGDICGIEEKITFHIAWHTFATTVTLENGVPINSVSKMLGHRVRPVSFKNVAKPDLIFLKRVAFFGL